ncbi:MAG: type IV secretory system conjugative DNA transfer family protein [Clostridia bacterium]|nr:type IV secretion system DNA-binding domain-containing protein [Clostridium sp.]
MQSRDIFLPEKSLYQNILITGTIGSGKTSSAIYPFSEQLIKYNSNNFKNKLGILCLDVKGNFYKQIKFYAKKFNRLKDLIIISLNSNETYNPLDKPNLNPLVLANRLKTILSLFSPNNSDSFWLDKVEQVICEAIKLCRLYNNNYVNFIELHKLINDKSYYFEKVKLLRNMFLVNKFSNIELYNLTSAITFFENEFFKLDERTISILKSEITRITLPFVSDYRISKVFSPSKNNITFSGFKDIIKSGKIVVLSMNISEFSVLSKIIATYMKLDFQSEVMSNLNSNNSRSVAFICDEYQEYITSSDANFFSESREAKCINIVSTQSYSSLLNTIKDESALKVILQNLVNKLWFRTDDIFTIENAQKQIGKEDKKKISKTISENAQESNYNYLIQKFKSKNSNISESINTYFQYDYVYDSNFFTQQLETFSCLAFLSNGITTIPPQKIDMYPYFK